MNGMMDFSCEESESGSSYKHTAYTESAYTARGNPATASRLMSLKRALKRNRGYTMIDTVEYRKTIKDLK